MLLRRALAEPRQARFLAPARLAPLRGSGGVRLEDCVLVTDDGVDNLTLCPRTVSEVESVCRGGTWPPKSDRAPWLRRRWSKLDKATGRMVVDSGVRVEVTGFTLDEDF